MSVPGYTAISFTAGEQPTTAKWNLVGSNDAAFNTFLSGPATVPSSVLTYASAPASAVISGTSWSGTGTTNILTGSYTFTAGAKYQIVVASSNPNSAGIWQLSYTVSGGGTYKGLSHTRFGGASGEQLGVSLINTFIPTASGAQTITVTATLITSGGANGDDIIVLIIPLPN
jgi:hypothetical protein